MYDHVAAENTAQKSAQAELGRGISNLAFEIVDTSGMLEELDGSTAKMAEQVSALTEGASRIGEAVQDMAERLTQIEEASVQSHERAKSTISDMQVSGSKAHKIAEWVTSLTERMMPLEERLKRVQTSAQRIAGIATEVNILAINARIEAARAGEDGRGFAVVAESIGQLSQQTADVTKTISEEIAGFAQSVGEMKTEATDMSSEATHSIDATQRSDASLTEIARDMERTCEDVQTVAAEARVAGEQNARFTPVLGEIAGRIDDAARAAHQGHEKLSVAAGNVETIIQQTVTAEIPTEDSEMIDRVREAAQEIGALFEAAINGGRISQNAMFDADYQVVHGSNPEQVTTQFTRLTDELLPEIQERMLESDPRVVFCAAVDRNGYLPTHNRKFSQPQGDDPVWNAANSRNRRIFDDRVGLKSGRSTAPFLLQVYRRDMGGGNTVMMKDLSAPIMVAGRHWGGLRLAYKPE